MLYYTNALAAAKMRNGSHPKSIYSLVNSWGGWDNTLNSGERNNALLTDLIAQQGTIKNQFTQLDNEYLSGSLTKQFHALCDKPEDLGGNVIAYRNWCNAQIVKTYSQNMVASAQARILFTDLRKTVDAFPSDKKQTLSYNTEDEINQAFFKFDTAMTNTFGQLSSLYVPTAGLPTALLDNMVKKGCAETTKFIFEGKETTVSSPNIVDWFVPPHSDSTLKPYITSVCNNTPNGKTIQGEQPVISKFFYTDKNSKEITEFKNILGVMVPNIFFDNPADYDNTTDWGFDQCGEKFWGSNNSSYCGYKLKIDSANVKVFNKTTAITNKKSSELPDILSTKEDFRFIIPGIQSVGQWVMKNIERAPNNIRYETFLSTQDDKSFNDKWTFAVATPEKGLSKVFLIRTHLQKDTGYAWGHLYTAYKMQCMTNDCSVSNDVLNFTGGTSITIKKGAEGEDNILSVK